MTKFKLGLRIYIQVIFLFSVVLIGLLVCWVKPELINNSVHDIKKFISVTYEGTSIWSDGFQQVLIKSNTDKELQKAYFLPSKGEKLEPLVVSLHTWSGNFKEFDSLAILCKRKNVNYIHPDFRGRNSNPKACGSDISVGDIDDAIAYAISNAKVDTNRIYVIGKSGGGYAAINVFMKSKHQINTISSWVPITDLSRWYYEGVIRKNKYPEDILKCTNSKNNNLNIDEARKRSPMYWSTPIRNSKLYIYAGIYDGIQGSVPISHSIDFYNKVLLEIKNTLPQNYVSDKEKLSLLSERKPIGNFGKIGTRKIALKKEYENIKLTVFEGGHEMLTKYALEELLNQK